MRTAFFEKEVKNAQSNFNRLFSNRCTCNLEQRHAAIFTICHLGILSRKISNSDREEERKKCIKEFMRSKTVLDKFFNKGFQ